MKLKQIVMKYWKQGFYDEPVDGSVEITEEYYQELLAGQSAGLIIVESKNCYPILVEYEYDIEEVRKMKISEIQIFEWESAPFKKNPYEYLTNRPMSILLKFKGKVYG